jgi:hypothetical protein
MLRRSIAVHESAVALLYGPAVRCKLDIVI